MRSRTSLFTPARLTLVGTSVALAALMLACGSSSSSPGGSPGGGDDDSDATTSRDGSMTSGDDTSDGATQSHPGDATTGPGGDSSGDDTTTDGSGSGSDGGNDGATGPGDGGSHEGGITDGAVDAHDGAPDAAVDSGPPTANFHLYGRIDTRDNAGPRYDWSGSGVTATFKGTGVAVHLTNTDTFSGPNEMQAVIDGTPVASGSPLVLTGTGTGTYTLASGLANGQHTVELYKRTEGYDGMIQFLGFQSEGASDTTWAYVPTVDPYTRHLEFVGDSITCGYGVLSTTINCTGNTYNDTEDAYLAYGAVAARSLSAAQVGIAYSGKGIYRDYNGDTTAGGVPQVPAIYGRTLESDTSSVYPFTQQVDAVIINLGTNDFHNGDPGAANFEGAFITFVTTIRSKYPSAYILLVAGPMVTSFSPFSGALGVLKGYLDAVVSARHTAGDTQIGDLEVASQDCGVEQCGCDSHPNVARQAAMAASVVTALKTAKGW